MKSLCYVVIPEAIALDHDSVYRFIKKQIARYHIEYEVASYRKFFTAEETREIAKRKGYDTIAAFQAALDIENDDDGIEDGLYYWNTTFNQEGHWDYFILDQIKPCQDLVKQEVPYSFVDADGIWHSMQTYGYKPRLDWESGKQHPDNVWVEREWKDFLDRTLYHSYIEDNIAIIMIHS